MNIMLHLLQKAINPQRKYPHTKSRDLPGGATAQVFFNTGKLPLERKDAHHDHDITGNGVE